MTIALPERADAENPPRSSSAAKANRAEAKRASDRARKLRLAEADHAKRTAPGQVQPTPELERRHEIAWETRIVERANGTAKQGRGRRVTTQTPLDRYYRRREIDRRQWGAGCKLRADFYRAGLEPRMVANLMSAGPGDGTPGLFKTERQVEAWKAWRAALKGVGTQLASVLVHVVCMDGLAADWRLGKHGAKRRPVAGRVSRRRQIEGMLALTMALNALADWQEGKR